MIFRRIIAMIIDLILLLFAAWAPLIGALIWLPQYMAAPAGQPPTLLMGVAFLWCGAVLFCYFPGFESSALMATPGKFLVRLKVVRCNGERLTFIQAVYRMIFGPLALFFMPFYLPKQQHHFSGESIVTNR